MRRLTILACGSLALIAAALFVLLGPLGGSETSVAQEPAPARLLARPGESSISVQADPVVQRSDEADPPPDNRFGGVSKQTLEENGLYVDEPGDSSSRIAPEAAESTARMSAGSKAEVRSTQLVMFHGDERSTYGEPRLAWLVSFAADTAEMPAPVGRPEDPEPKASPRANFVIVFVDANTGAFLLQLANAPLS